MNRNQGLGFFKRLLVVVAIAAGVLMAADIPIGLNRGGANVSQARVKVGDRVQWSGNNWRTEFVGRTPCQNGKRVFASTEAGNARVCVISVRCSASDRTGCGRYKYNSSADGGPVIDPELEVEPLN